MSVQNVNKVTLSSGKVVLLRELQIKHQEMAALAVAQKANGNPAILSMLMQKEMLKQLIVSIDGKPINGAQLELLDTLFSFQEWMQLNQVFAKLMGADEDLGKFQLEVVTSGDK